MWGEGGLNFFDESLSTFLQSNYASSCAEIQSIYNMDCPHFLSQFVVLFFEVLSSGQQFQLLSKGSFFVFPIKRLRRRKFFSGGKSSSNESWEGNKQLFCLAKTELPRKSTIWSKVVNKIDNMIKVIKMS